MGTAAGDRRVRVFVPQALGADEFLRATWHPGRAVVVVSHWHGAECVAATPVRVADLGELVGLLRAALDASRPAAWPAPPPEALVVPADGFAVPRPRRVA